MNDEEKEKLYQYININIDSIKFMSNIQLLINYLNNENLDVKSSIKEIYIIFLIILNYQMM